MLLAEEMAEPFITLSSSSPSSADGGNISDSPNTSPEESFDELTPLPGLLSATHDTRRAGYHMKDLEAFAKDLQNAADRAFPNEGRTRTRYSTVSVLLLRWEDDEMNVEWELDDLEKVFRNYGFGTDRWLIPTKNSHLKLMSKVVDVVEENDGNGGLVIVYYAGHAGINSSRGATWTCKQDPAYASLEWSAIQTLFEKADFDVLLLLDCCAAASAAPAVGSAVTETIAACGFESIAPQPGRYSFTNSLIEVLEEWIDSPPFSAAMLHNKVLSVLKHERPERMQNGKRRRLECRRTPIHMVATADPTLPSIELGRRLPRQDNSQGGIPSTAASSSNPRVRECESPDDIQSSISKGKSPQLDSVKQDQGNEFEAPRVIISLAVEKHQKLNSESCQKWLASCPTLIKFAKVEAVYSSFSVLVLLSLPISIWNLLPENAACSFVGYVTSPNFLAKCLLPAKEIAASTQLEVISPQKSSPKETSQTCNVCYEMKVECNGDPAGCITCKLAHMKCVYPILRKDGPSKDYIEGLQKRLHELELALEEEKARNAAFTTGALVLENPKHVTLPRFQNLVSSEYRADAADYDKSLLQRLDHRRPGAPYLDIEMEPLRASSQRPIYPSPMSDRGPVEISDPKISAAQAQQNEFVRQQILMRDAMFEDSTKEHGTPPLPLPHLGIKDDEASWNDKKLAWLAPKSEHEYSRSPSLQGGKVMVKTEPSSPYDFKARHGPPEKKMKISTVTDTSHSGTGKVVGAGSISDARATPKTRTPLSAHFREYHGSPQSRTSDESSAPYATEPFDVMRRSFEAQIRSSTNTQQLDRSTYDFSETSERQPRENLSKIMKTGVPLPISAIVAPRSASDVDQDWTYITDIAERRRIQNRIAQRNYRKRLKRRIEDLERAGGSSSQPSVPTDDMQHYTLPSITDRDQSVAGNIVKDLQHFRHSHGVSDTLGRYMPEGGSVDGGLHEDMSV